MPATLRGIYHNLLESKYVISNQEITFYFSSEVYLQKYLDGYKQHRILFNERIRKITKDIPLNTDSLADIHFYKIIEKRGFLAKVKRIKMDYNEVYQYALRKMIEKDSYEWIKVG
jgi:hypothetical protein